MFELRKFQKVSSMPTQTLAVQISDYLLFFVFKLIPVINDNYAVCHLTFCTLRFLNKSEHGKSTRDIALIRE